MVGNATRPRSIHRRGRQATREDGGFCSTPFSFCVQAIVVVSPTRPREQRGQSRGAGRWDPPHQPHPPYQQLPYHSVAADAVGQGLAITTTTVCRHRRRRCSKQAVAHPPLHLAATTDRPRPFQTSSKPLIMWAAALPTSPPQLPSLSPRPPPPLNSPPRTPHSTGNPPPLW